MAIGLCQSSSLPEGLSCVWSSQVWLSKHLYNSQVFNGIVWYYETSKAQGPISVDKLSRKQFALCADKSLFGENKVE